MKDALEDFKKILVERELHEEIGVAFRFRINYDRQILRLKKGRGYMSEYTIGNSKQIIISQAFPDKIKNDYDLSNQSTDDEAEDPNETIREAFTTTIFANGDNIDCGSCKLGCHF